MFHPFYFLCVKGQSLELWNWQHPLLISSAPTSSPEGWGKSRKQKSESHAECAETRRRTGGKEGGGRSVDRRGGCWIDYDDEDDDEDDSEAEGGGVRPKETFASKGL